MIRPTSAEDHYPKHLRRVTHWEETVDPEVSR